MCEAGDKDGEGGDSAVLCNWERVREIGCVCTHETHFTQLSTYILHPADEVSEKVAVLWQIKSTSCKAGINLAFPSE